MTSELEEKAREIQKTVHGITDFLVDISVFETALRETDRAAREECAENNKKLIEELE